jgi:1,6-anhydro-N-acetylmuramate kinase
MATKAKIRIKDDVKLRAEIDELYENMNKIDLAKWSLKIAKRTLRIAGVDYKNIDVIIEGFRINELWQKEEARMHDVRQVGFKIHKLAHDSDSEIQKSALRTVGQAVASGHMKEHAMVASDYAIKTIGLIRNNDIGAITKERKWQLNELNKLKNEIHP